MLGDAANEAKRLYEAGMTVEELAARFGFGRTTVVERLHEAGATMRPGKVVYVRLLDKHWVLSLYRKCGYDTGKMAGAVGCNRGTVYYRLKALGIPTQIRRGGVRSSVP